ncbi:RsiV family protein [Hydrogenimonas sp. SS33]|uniref:RsiV family protein n=1 Tax=Hydrogenimonas leucolamina TaxID=2954236 RepID=UPI00336BFA1E
MQKFYLYLLCFTTLLLAKSPYLNPYTASELPKITLQAFVCSKDNMFCIEKKLSTYDPHEASFPAEFAPFRSLFARQVEAYYDDDIRAELASDRNDTPDLSGNYYRHTDTSLFALTPTTLTLQYERSSYEGGAHGNYGIAYENFLRSNAAPVTLKKLFKPGTHKKLLAVAERYYRLAYNIPDDQNMRYDGWFDASFTLAENFAITPNGLLFVYNQYEIKPYAAGLTRFLLPYSAIESLIDPKGALAFVRRQSHTTQHYTFREDPLTLTLDVAQTKDVIDLNVTLRSDTCTRSGNWLSLSFPQLHSKKALLAADYSRFRQLATYDTHDKLYNRQLHKNVPARYLLVEARQPTVYPNTLYTMHIRLKAPKNLSPLIIDLRALAKTRERTYTAPYDYDGTRGQQGYQNYRVLFDLHEIRKKNQGSDR